MPILLSNDDGVNAPGLAALAQALKGLDDLVVSAPSENRSGVGMGITLNRHLEAEHLSSGLSGEERYSVDGTPADAAKFGLQHLLKNQKPRLVASGINYGPNLGVNTRCSGTIGAAFEAVAAGVMALAVSVEFVPEPNWAGAIFYARKLAEKILALPAVDEPFLLNLNVPAKNPEDIRGLVIARHGRGGIHDTVKVSDDGGVMRLVPDWIQVCPDSDCDASAFYAGYAVVTPFRFEMTYDAALAQLLDEWKGDVESYSEVVKGNNR